MCPEINEGQPGRHRFGSAMSEGKPMTVLEDLITEFNGFKPNCRAHADFYLRNGRLHPDAHWVIQERLAKWVRRLEQAGPALREELLAELEGAG
jgi:hypothetical protein